MYVSDNCGGCLQVPTPVYWSPYLAPAFTRRPSFHIADILPAPSALHKGPPDNSAAFLLSAGIPTEAAVYADRRLQQKVTLHVTRQSDVKDANRTTNERISISKRDLYRSVHHRSRRQDPDRLGADGPCRLSSALGPLKALCVAGGREFPFSSAGQGRLPGGHATSPKELSFGINQILSDDFGRQDKENVKVRSDRPEPDIRTCECTAIDSSLFQPLYLPGHALSGVRTLQPPYYPDSPPGTDILPGPYSVMNSDVNVGSHQKRKRSWSRAVFSNLQRKGLEKRFDVQKYVTKPDRRQLAAMLGLTDAQVKVWFQNRRMKWRHTQQTTSENEKNSASDVDDTPVVTFQESEQDSALVKNEHAIELEVTDNAADVISDDNDMACNFTESNDNTSPESRDNS